MKTNKILHYFNFLALVLSAGGVSQLQAKEPTALELIKEGNKHVGEHAQDKVVQVRSDKSVGDLTPSVWYVVYYDSTATLKATEVKFEAGKFRDMKRPLRLLEPVTGGYSPMAKDKLKVDSDKAIHIAKKEPLLDKVELKATKLKLERGEAGKYPDDGGRSAR